MRSRRKAREAALQALYQCDTQADWSSEAIDLYFEVYCRPPEAGDDDTLTDLDPADQASAPAQNARQENLQFARRLIDGVIDNGDFVDSRISEASIHWKIERMSRIDRNILRLAVFEMAMMPEIPLNVTLNEAIELAKRYGADESPMFVNGVLDKVARGISASREQNAEPEKVQVV